VPNQEYQERKTGRIVSFPSRSRRARQEQAGRSDPKETLVADLHRYEQSAEPDDYAQRMRINAAAFALILVLTLAGVWLAEQLALLRKHEDCAFTGLKNCAETELHVRGR